MDFIATPRKKAVKQTQKKKETAKMTPKDTYKKTKAAHRAAIHKLKQDIKKHKLLERQAKTIYKLSKLTDR